MARRRRSATMQKCRKSISAPARPLPECNDEMLGADSLSYPPPCGEGRRAERVGVGVLLLRTRSPPPPTPPHKGEGRRGGRPMTDIMLKIDSLSAWYGAARILYDLSFEVGRGEVVALMGRNGAGKSTTMKAIMGLIAQRAGAVRFNGRDISRLKPFEIARLGLGFTPEDRRIFVDLTVMENLDVGRQSPRQFADGQPAPSWTPEKLFALFPNLAEMPQRPGGRMSGGEQQMLTVARTLMGNPLLVLLDEPSEGVAPLIVEEMANTIAELKKEGLSVLLSEQNIHFAGLVADRAYVLEKGQVRWHGAMAALMGDAAV